MTEESARLINEWRQDNARRFEELITLLKKEAVSDILEKICPLNDVPRIQTTRLPPTKPVEDAAEFEASAAGKISHQMLEKLAARQRGVKAEPKPKKVYANPEDDPNYGMLGSDAESAPGTMGGIVTDIVE